MLYSGCNVLLLRYYYYYSFIFMCVNVAYVGHKGKFPETKMLRVLIAAPTLMCGSIMYVISVAYFKSRKDISENKEGKAAFILSNCLFPLLFFLCYLVTYLFS